MGKAKLTLTSAITMYKKIKATKFLQLTEKAIAKFIDEQISLKTNEIKEVQEETKETVEEMEDDFQVALLDLDETNIGSTGARKETAEEYVIDALSELKDIEDYKENQDDIVKFKTKQIEQLERLRTQLEKLSDTIVIEEEV